MIIKLKRLKQLLIVIVLVLLFNTTSAQIKQPVHWSYGTKKLTDGTTELHLLASIDAGWHIYSQKKTKASIAIPTNISFSKVDGLTLLGKPAEIGKLNIYKIKEVGVTNYEYANKVDFVQKVKVDPGIKELKGTIIFQTCTHKQCLPEDKVNFTIPIHE